MSNESIGSEDEREEESLASQADEEKLSYDVKTEFETLKEDYELVLKGLEKKDAIKKFVPHYESIYKKLVEMHDNENILKDGVTQLQNKLTESRNQYASLLDHTHKDQEKIDSLKKELNKAHTSLDAAHVREQNLQETLDNLRSQVTKLTHEIDLRNQLEMEEIEEGGAAIKNKAILQRERDRLQREKNALVEEITELKADLESLREKHLESEKNVAEMSQELKIKTRKNYDASIKMDVLSSDLKNTKNELKSKDQEIKNLKDKTLTASQTLEKTEKRVREEQWKNDMKTRECEKLKGECLSLKVDIARYQSRIESLKVENANALKEYKLKTDEVESLTRELEKMVRQSEVTMKKFQNAENAKGLINLELIQEQDKVITLRRELEIMHKKDEVNQRLTEDLAREKEVLKNNLRRISGSHHKQTEELKTEKHARSTLIKDMNNLSDDFNKQSNQMKELMKENNRLQGQISDTHKELQNINDELKNARAVLLDHKKQINELECKLKQQQNLFDSVWSDRNTFSKNLLEAKDEVTELKQNIKVMTHQIEQIKEDITTKEMQLMKETADREKAEKERENLKAKLQKLQGDLVNCQLSIEKMQKEENRLQKLISEAEMDRLMHKKEVDQLLNERDLLGTQLIRKNDELSLLYEKVKILESSLQRGETQYAQRLEDIRLLKIEVRRLRQEKTLMEKALNNSTDLRQEVFHLERDLMQERLKSKALEEELTNPVNVHRWRKLEGTDPEAYELLQKMQLMQKRLLMKAAEGEEQAEQLDEARKVNQDLQKLLERLPGPEAAIQLHESQQALREQKRKIKALEAELMMYESQASEFKFNLERANEELHLTRKKMLEKKKVEMKQKEREQKPPLITKSDALPSRKCHFMGGGFNTSVTLKS